MSLRPPSPDAFAAEVNRERRRQQEEQLRRDAVRNRFRLVFFVFAALALVALVADTRNISRKLHERTASQAAARRGDAADIAAGLHDARYVDPAGLFSLVPPRNWVKVDKPLDGFFNVAFQGPYGMDMGIQVAATNGLTFNGLIEKLQQRERDLSANTHMDFAYVGPYRAVKRTVQLYKTRLLILDFLTGDLEHHVQFSIPPNLYDEYEPVFLRLMQTYEPGRILPAPGPQP